MKNAVVCTALLVFCSASCGYGYESHSIKAKLRRISYQSDEGITYLRLTDEISDIAPDVGEYLTSYRHLDDRTEYRSIRQAWGRLKSARDKWIRSPRSAKLDIRMFEYECSTWD